MDEYIEACKKRCLEMTLKMERGECKGMSMIEIMKPYQDLNNAVMFNIKARIDLYDTPNNT